MTEHPVKLLRHLDDVTLEGVFHLKDFDPFLKEPDAARLFREVAQRFSKSRSTLVLTRPSIHLPEEIEHLVVRFPLELPSHKELRRTLKSVARSLARSHKFEIELESGEGEELVRALGGLTFNQARQVIAYAILEDRKLCAEDIGRVLDRKAQAIRDGGLLEYLPPDENHSEFGGFERLKAWLERAAIGFTPKAKEIHLRAPRGILISGVQGCAKSLAAKVLARQWRLPLLKLDAGRLFDKYIGESEKNLRRAIELAEAMAPAVLWIDEIEKGLAQSRNLGVDGGLLRRLFGTFLTWLQKKRDEIFVVAIANDLNSLPPELLRTGRFDEIFFVDLPTPPEREAIFALHLGLRKQRADDLDVAALIDATDGFSGAEIEQVVIGGLYRALQLDQTLETEVLLTEIQQAVPLSVARAEDITALREMARGRFVNAN